MKTSTWTITRKSWVYAWSDYRDSKGHGPARTYYRKTEITKALAHYSTTPINLDMLTPESSWNNVSDIGHIVTRTVEPYRVVR